MVNKQNFLRDSVVVNTAPREVYRFAGIGSVTDEALIIRFLNGDNDAFNTLVTRWQKPIYNFVLRYAADSDSAKDLTQQTFIRAYGSLRKLENPTRFSSWLYRIALNAARDAGRSSQRHPTVSTSDEAVSNELRMPLSSIQTNWRIGVACGKY
jgi:DNA-directed RNA polymerase specialized sigma24 family protein